MMTAVLNKLHTLLRDPAFIRYSVIGVTGIIIDFLLYLFLVKVGVNPTLATSLSITLAILNNFILNLKFNFNVNTHIIKRFILFYSVGLVGLILSVLVIYLLNNVCLINPVLAKLLSIPPIVLLQYWLNKNVSFTDDFRGIPHRKIALVALAMAVVVAFAAGSMRVMSQDEADNVLGSHIVASGGVIYKDYFSHHAPLLYYIGAPLAAVVKDNIVAYKVIFGILTAIWLLVISKRVARLYGVRASVIFTGLITVAQVPMGYNGFLAETIIAFSLCHVVVLFLDGYRGLIRRGYGTVVAMSLLSGIPALASASYAPLSIIMYCMSLSLVFIRPDLHYGKKGRLLLASIISFSLPFVMLTLYFVMNHAFGRFIAEAFKFNTKYYSIFEPSAPRGTIDALLQVVGQSLSGLYKALVGNGIFMANPIMTLFVVAILLALAILYRSHSKVVAWVFAVALFVGGAREGFYAILTIPPFADIPTRSGYMVFFLASLLFAITLVTQRSNKRDTLAKAGIAVIVAAITVAGIFSSAKTIEFYRQLERNKEVVATHGRAGSVANTINKLINSDQYYWVGPWDFQSQIFINSKNASSYRFYLPWHAVCPECNRQILADFSSRKPSVIYFDMQSYNYWMSSRGLKLEDGALYNYIISHYYTVTDESLKNYYFDNDDRTETTIKLKALDYKV